MTIHCDRKITENGEQEGKSPDDEKHFNYKKLQ